MSYATSNAVQIALFQRLSGDPGLSDLVGSEVYDAVPPGVPPAVYVTLGEEDVRDRSDGDSGGALHDVTISVVSDAPGFSRAKSAAVAISDAILAPGLTLERGRVVGLWFLKARARRIRGGDQRRIDLRFRIQTQDI
ncbi:DUF3168 domain-containing protein [Oceaniglobus indicus]|uniref:DUF3168 domain-containing protein n=1 Tax=Oceaniglobus indicus TaxID=2047749 RepID=UPI000C1A2768|nr:DUF3168 domain-containing protein [Oceaniglobus indicus]